MKFLTTNTPTNESKLQSPDDSVAGFVKSEYDRYSKARYAKTTVWELCWASYLGTPQAMEYAEKISQSHVGDVRTQWRHRINTGKAFEVIETINSYLQGSFFPNRDWFDLIPHQPTYKEMAKVMKKYLMHKFDKFNFKTVWDAHCRQSLILGTSVLALPWRAETVGWKKWVKNPRYKLDKQGNVNEIIVPWEVQEEEKIIKQGPQFEVLDMFDCFLDPDAIDPNEANFIRRIIKTKAEVLRLVDTGFYNKGKKQDIIDIKPTSLIASDKDSKRTVQRFQGIDYDPKQKIEIVEFWGDVELPHKTYHDVVVTVTGNKLLRMEPNPYWGGRPFNIMQCVPIPRSVYGLGVIESVMGMLQELNIITNQRLDNLELSVNRMWTLIDDGVLRPDQVFSEPGAVFPVGNHDDLRPIPNATGFEITYEESGLLEQRIDKTIGTGPYVGVGAGRNAERVTAQEVNAQKEAGGNRLTGVQVHLEQTGLIPTLDKVYRSCQQFVTKDEQIRIPTEDRDVYQYVEVGPQELTNDYDLIPVGAGHIADKEFELNKRIQFVQLVSANPEMFKHIDYLAVVKDLANRMGFDDSDQYIKEGINQPPVPETPPPEPSQEEELNQTLFEMGGKPMQDAFANNMAADGGQTLGTNLMQGMGMIGQDEQIPPEMLMQAQGAMTDVPAPSV